MTWDCHKSRMLVSDTASGAIYEVNTVHAALTMVAEVPDADFGSGLAIDGSNDFTQLSDLAAEADDLEYAPACN
jgi:hypothetical protein